MTFSIRRSKFEEFKKNFKEGAYKGKTLGAAFYDRFELGRSYAREDFVKLKKYDKREAVEQISKLFHFLED